MTITKDAKSKTSKSSATKTSKRKAAAKSKDEQVRDESPETPSGAARDATKSIKDDVERGEEYLRTKVAVRRGIVPPEDADSLVK